MRILITAGPTREYIDPVRYLSNASSGKMGIALAAAAGNSGHTVTLIAGPVTCPMPKNIAVVPVISAKQMFEAVKRHFTKSDALIMAAAVADYTPKSPAKNKIKKSDPGLHTLELIPTDDILHWAGQNKSSQIVTGFALEDTHPRQNAQKKLIEKNLDMIVLNSPAAIAASRSKIEILIAPDTWHEYPPESKTDSARRIITHLEQLAGRTRD